MATPRKTAGMLNFERQLDAVFPDRQRPDGWIADDNHTGTSSHHPDDTRGSRPEWDGDPDTIPDVRGVDVWSDLGPGVDSLAVCRHIAAQPRVATVVRYLIHKGLIWHERNRFIPVPYDGDDNHPTHIHVTFAFTEAADDNTSFDYRLEAIPVALTAADKKWILDAIKGNNKAAAAEVRTIARTNAEFLSDTEKKEIVDSTAAAVVAQLPAA